MLDDKARGVLDQLINQALVSIPILMASIREDKADFHVKNESDYAIGLAHGVIISGFVSDFSILNKREPNRTEMTEVNKVLLKRREELSEAVYKGR